MLRRMFTDHNCPFYKSAVTIHIDKPPVDESVRFVVDRFAGDGEGGEERTTQLSDHYRKTAYAIDVGTPMVYNMLMIFVETRLFTSR